jgi:hypothetical protein
VRLLRTAFLKTLSDPEFVNDARQAQLEIDPISGEDVTRLIGELFHDATRRPREAQGAAPLSGDNSPPLLSVQSAGSMR